MPHSHSARARAWTLGDPRAHVRPRTGTYFRARGRPLTHATAVARNSQVYAIMLVVWYCVILREVVAKITQHHAQIEPSSIVREGTCVTHVVYARPRTCTRVLRCVSVRSIIKCCGKFLSLFPTLISETREQIL